MLAGRSPALTTVAAVEAVLTARVLHYYQISHVKLFIGCGVTLEAKREVTQARFAHEVDLDQRREELDAAVADLRQERRGKDVESGVGSVGLAVDGDIELRELLCVILAVEQVELDEVALVAA